MLSLGFIVCTIMLGIARRAIITYTKARVAHAHASPQSLATQAFAGFNFTIPAFQFPEQ